MAFKIIWEGNSKKPKRAGKRGDRAAIKQAGRRLDAKIERLSKSRAQIDERNSLLRSRVLERQGRTTEHGIALGVLQYLAESAPGEATVQELQEVIPEVIELTPEDLKQSVTRPNEGVWVQLFRNIVSHRRMPGNVVHDGLLSYDPHGRLSITEKGKYELRRQREEARTVS